MTNALERDSAEPGGLDAAALADEIDYRIRALPDQSTEPVRRLRREYSRRLRDTNATEALAVTEALVGRQRWVAYELLYDHPSRLAGLGITEVERLGAGLGGGRHLRPLRRRSGVAAAADRR